MMRGIVDLLRDRLPGPVRSALKPLYRAMGLLLSSHWGVARLLSPELTRSHLYDARRFWEHAVAMKASPTRARAQTRIILLSHCVEKGLAHPAPRARFGQSHVDGLLVALAEYVPRYGRDTAAAMGLDALAEYCRFHRQQGVPMDAVEAVLKELPPEPEGGRCHGSAGGSMPITRTDIHSSGRMDIEAFLRSRHSIRSFDARPVARELIEKAVSLAITTPSVCNRQMWKARVFHDPDRLRAMLALQNGNRGFGEQITTLIVVTCDLQSFTAIGERNEAWIDGGMFSMSLVLALHSLGLGTCCLNWSVIEEQDRRLRELIQLPEPEVVIMLIAVGYIPERLSVTRSVRRPLDEIMRWES
jgi:nitroreductase